MKQTKKDEFARHLQGAAVGALCGFVIVAIVSGIIMLLFFIGNTYGALFAYLLLGAIVGGLVGLAYASVENDDWHSKRIEK